jgi:hypothetical protein
MGKKALDFVPHKGTNYYKNGAVVELKAKTDENCQLTEVASH